MTLKIRVGLIYFCALDYILMMSLFVELLPFLYRVFLCSNCFEVLNKFANFAFIGFGSSFNFSSHGIYSFFANDGVAVGLLKGLVELCRTKLVEQPLLDRRW